MRILLLLCLTSAATAQPLELRNGGHTVPVQLQKFGMRRLITNDPTDNHREAIFNGIPLQKVLAPLPVPRGADTLAVRCNDGWLSLVPLEKVRTHPDALLARFVEEKKVSYPLPPPRAPLFLVWPRGAVDSEDWSFSVASLEYVNRKDFLQRLGSDSPGRQLFEKNCLHCHALLGAGGQVGWDLRDPPLASYLDRTAFAGLLADPRRRNPSGHMPAFRGLRPGEVAALYLYLVKQSESVGEVRRKRMP